MVSMSGGFPVSVPPSDHPQDAVQSPDLQLPHILPDIAGKVHMMPRYWRWLQLRQFVQRYWTLTSSNIDNATLC